MRKARKAMNKKRIISGIVLVWLTASICVFAVPRSGEAIVAARVGKIQARVFVGPVHEGNTELKDLSEGMSIGETSRIVSGKNGRACVVLTPGAILCVAPETELTFKQLRHSSDGLPKSEDDLIRRIHIELHHGRILLHGSAPTPLMDMHVEVDAGEIDATGGTFVVAQTDEGEWAVISEENEPSVTPNKGAPMAVPEGSAVALTLSDEGVATVEEDSGLLESPARQFEVCECFFDDLETYIHNPGGFDRPGLSRYIGSQSGVEFVGQQDSTLDVSPSVPKVIRTEKRVETSTEKTITRTNWDNQRARLWYENLGVVKGVNYIPRNAVNSTAMWMEDTFDPELIDEEMGWAQDAGYTTLRIQLQYAVWKEDPEGFVERIKKFMELAEDHDLQVVPVLFDDRNFAQADPVVGPQPDPIPGQHNAHWTPSPGVAAIQDRTVWPELEEYVKGIIDEFKGDERIVYWDLYNRTGDNGLGEATLPLMDQTFNWAREVDPKQPLAVAAWTRPESAMTTRMLERSDIITFQSFESADQIEALLLLLKRYERPIICSDWLMRQKGNDFEKVLPLFSVNRIGWFNRGLVNGKTQEWIQQERYRSEADPEVWQHDVLTTEGEPYDEEEIQKIQEFRFQDRF